MKRGIHLTSFSGLIAGQNGAFAIHDTEAAVFKIFFLFQNISQKFIIKADEEITDDFLYTQIIDRTAGYYCGSIFFIQGYPAETSLLL